jgi:hypothetical protein
MAALSAFLVVLCTTLLLLSQLLVALAVMVLLMVLLCRLWQDAAFRLSDLMHMLLGCMALH